MTTHRQQPVTYNPQTKRTEVEFQFQRIGRKTFHIIMGRNGDYRGDPEFLSWARQCADGVFKAEGE